MATPLVLEDGTRVLLESGGYLFLENATTDPVGVTVESVRRRFTVTGASQQIVPTAVRRR